MKITDNWKFSTVIPIKESPPAVYRQDASFYTDFLQKLGDLTSTEFFGVIKNYEVKADPLYNLVYRDSRMWLLLVITKRWSFRNRT